MIATMGRLDILKKARLEPTPPLIDAQQRSAVAEVGSAATPSACVGCGSADSDTALWITCQPWQAALRPFSKSAVHRQPLLRLAVSASTLLGSLRWRSAIWRSAGRKAQCKQRSRSRSGSNAATGTRRGSGRPAMPFRVRKSRYRRQRNKRRQALQQHGKTGVLVGATSNLEALDAERRSPRCRDGACSSRGMEYGRRTWTCSLRAVDSPNPHKP